MFFALRETEARRVERTGIEAKRLYTVEEAAAYLGRSVYAMRHLIADGLVPTVRIGPKGKRLHIDKKDLDKLIEKNKLAFRNW